MDDYLTKAYTGFHGDTSGLAELKTQAKSAALPPAGFKIASVREISLRRSAAGRRSCGKDNPQLAAWKAMKQGLTDRPELLRADERREAAEAARQGREGRAEANRPGALRSNHRGSRRSKFEAPVKADAGATLQFEGVAESFIKEPFMLTLDADKADVEGLSLLRRKSPLAAKAKGTARKR